MIDFLCLLARGSGVCMVSDLCVSVVSDSEERAWATVSQSGLVELVRLPQRPGHVYFRFARLRRSCHLRALSHSRCLHRICLSSSSNDIFTMARSVPPRSSSDDGDAAHSDDPERAPRGPAREEPRPVVRDRVSDRVPSAGPASG